MPEPANRSTLPRALWAVWERTWWVFGIVMVGGSWLLANRDPALLVRVWGLLFSTVGIAALVYVERMRRQQRRSRSWTPVQGRVLASSVEKEILRSRPGHHSPITGGGIATYFPRVEYAYEYQGAPYQSKRIITVNINWPKKEAEEAVAHYPAGASVTVWVDPTHPDQAVLETSIERYTRKYRLAFFIGAAFLLAGIAGWLTSALFEH